MSQNPHPPQSDFPLTLAEVLFKELKTKWDIVNAPPQPGENPDARKKVQAVWEAMHTSWEDVENKIKEIQDLKTEEGVLQICQQKGIQIDSSADTPAGRIWDCKYELSKKIVPGLYRIIRGLAPTRSALCLSGGGVRSAIYNLGTLQGLARCKLLEKFDYLSTVSGGGFIGGWLTAWIHRENGNVGAVSTQLAKVPDNPLETEPTQLYNLRVYANYLTPRKGLMSVDTWTLIAVYLRNLLLNWMVFVPPLMAILMFPRIWVAFIKSQHLYSQLGLWGLPIVGFASACIALVYIGANLPEARTWNFDGRRFVKFCLAPLVVSSMALTTYWFRFQQDKQLGWREFAGFSMLLGLLSWTVCIGLRIYARRRDKKAGKETNKADGSRWRAFGRYALATLLILLAFFVSGWLTWCVTDMLPSSLTSHVRLYASLAVPLLLILLSLGGTFIGGFTSRFTDVDDQEWWARCGAWILIVVLGWGAFHLVVLFGPSLFVRIGDLWATLIGKKSWSWDEVKPAVSLIIGGTSAAFAALGGKSKKTSAHGETPEPETEGLLPLALPVLALIGAAFILITLALITNWILASPFGAWLGAPFSLKSNDPIGIIHQTPLRVLLMFGALIVGVGYLLGRAINTNRFSLHYYWRNRMMRAYLGATRDPQERAMSKTRNRFTDFDDEDNEHMSKLLQKPLHVVNLTLNLAGGEKLQWQDRKAESFTVSPLHAGSYWLGYRRSDEYALNRKDEGISLATAVAISGAAASPNMGYMMTSPVVRFIMTLFNVRLGFWLGNPGVAGGGNWTTLGKRTFRRDSPTQSVRPIFAEAFGETNDKSPYVYLSDGGHFENLGLYEMILRRCRFIVIGDGSSDEKYTFGSLAMAIRQIRVDFGVPIDMGEMELGNEPNARNNYCAVGVIRYSCVDRRLEDSNEPDSKYDGVLVYLKPSLIGDEPRDVLNYHATSTTFPQESIVDQWFSEPQFESYRALGSHMVEAICKVCSKTAAKGSGESGQPPPSGSPKTAGSDSECEKPSLKDRVEAIVNELRKATGSEDDSAVGKAFADFVTNAGKHVARPRESAPKDS
jgi:Patatin-like phospholipase